MKGVKRLVFLLMLLVLVSSVFAETEKVVVVASTSWTGAMAKAAGADEVRVLAPFELQHPPEYDFRPSDIQRLEAADFLVWAGYEPFIKRLQESTEFPPTQVIRVITVNTPSNLINEVTRLGKIFGTEKKANDWVRDFTMQVEAMKKRAQELGINEQRVVVQQHQEAFVRWLGYEVVGVFSAEELTPAKVMEFARLKPQVVIDNFHNPQGKGVAEVAEIPRVELRNFPSESGDDLRWLFQENWVKLEKFLKVDD
ncbi:MAG TPA: hypothetical protein DDW93_12510 [Firmicutes bacterium]|jgi:zinc transport system substrate-binding protein/iron/zinc/copper transport system substrate-binding protein|nr:hypothetical protein [Bacillota bacterium]HBK68982.1 hypothetical protein [Bacillota bacterium]